MESNHFFVLKTKEGEFVGLEALGEGPSGGYEFLKTAIHPRTLRFATQQNANFVMTWSGAHQWMKDQYAAGFLSIEEVWL